MVSLSLIYLISMEQQERESERESESLDTASLGHITAAAAALSPHFSIHSFIQPNSTLIASCSLSLLIHLHQQYRCQQLF